MSKYQLFCMVVQHHLPGIVVVERYNIFLFFPFFVVSFLHTTFSSSISSKENQRPCHCVNMENNDEYLKMKTGLNGEKDVTTYFCSKDYCNSGFHHRHYHHHHHHHRHRHIISIIINLVFFFRKYGWTHTGIPSGGNCTGSKSLKHCFQWLETFETFSLARNL